MRRPYNLLQGLARGLQLKQDGAGGRGNALTPALSR